MHFGKVQQLSAQPSPSSTGSTRVRISLASRHLGVPLLAIPTIPRQRNSICNRRSILVDSRSEVALTYGGFFPALDESAEKPRANLVSAKRN